MNNLSERQAARAEKQIDEAIAGYNQIIKEKQEMMTQLNKELERAISMKHSLLNAHGALFDEEEL